jgi:hypothetical protein
MHRVNNYNQSGRRSCKQQVQVQSQAAVQELMRLLLVRLQQQQQPVLPLIPRQNLQVQRARSKTGSKIIAFFIAAI